MLANAWATRPKRPRRATSAASGTASSSATCAAPGGEIDIVAQDGATLVFIEVKARDSAGYGSALAAVDARKRKRIRAIAEDYLQYFAPSAKARFDVLTIEHGVIRLHRGAFR